MILLNLNNNKLKINKLIKLKNWKLILKFKKYNKKIILMKIYRKKVEFNLLF